MACTTIVGLDRGVLCRLKRKCGCGKNEIRCDIRLPPCWVVLRVASVNHRGIFDGDKGFRWSRSVEQVDNVQFDAESDISIFERRESVIAGQTRDLIQ